MEIHHFLTSTVFSATSNGVKHVVILLIRAYHGLVSPALHTLVPIRSGCRFVPTCSEYAIEVIMRDGVIQGIRKSVIRLAQCHPLSKLSV